MIKKITVSIVLAGVICTHLSAKEEYVAVVTSATKSEQSIKNVTSTVEVITGAELSEKHTTTVIDALRNIVNVPMGQSGGIGQQSSFFLRGFSSGNTLILVDGIKYNDPTTTEGQAQLEHLMINDIERIEIIKGAQSGVWGANAVAGVINIITKKPTEKLAVNANMEAGSYNTQKYNLSVSQKIDKLSYYLGMNYLKSDGISAETPSGTKPNDYESDSYDNKTINAKLTYQLTDSNELKFNLTSISAKVDYDGCDAVWPATCSSVEKANNSSRKLTQSNTIYGVGLVHQFGSSANVEIDYENGSFEKKDPLGWTKEFKGENSKLSAKSKVDYIQDSFVLFGFDKTKDEDKLNSHKLDSSAIFATNSNKFGKLILTESLRGDFYDTFEDKVTGKIGAKYNLSNDISISANYATGYKAPSLYQLYDSTYGNKNLKPETTVSRDSTFEYKHLKATYFQSEITDLIGYNQATFVNEQVAGTSKIKGYEFKYSNEVFKELLINASYVIMSAKNKDGQDLQRRADKSVGTSIDYYGIDKFHFGLSANYIGSRYDDIAKTKQTGKYTLFNGIVNYDVNKIYRVYVKVDNLTDKKYQEVDGYGTYGRAIYAGVSAKF